MITVPLTEGRPQAYRVPRPALLAALLAIAVTALLMGVVDLATGDMRPVPAPPDGAFVGTVG